MKKVDTPEYLRQMSYIGETPEQTQERLDDKRARGLLKRTNSRLSKNKIIKNENR